MYVASKVEKSNRIKEEKYIIHGTSTLEFIYANKDKVVKYCFLSHYIRSDTRMNFIFIKFITTYVTVGLVTVTRIVTSR